jgi:hypothetical protein
MLIILGLGIGCYGLWTSYVSIFSLIAESGGKDSKPWLALGVLWPLVELIRSWLWLNKHPHEYAISRSRGWGNGLVLCAIVVSPPITLTAFIVDGPVYWQLGVALPALMIVIACWTARKLWSHAEESASKSVLGL